MYISPQELIVLCHAIKAKDGHRVMELTEGFITKYGGEEVLRSRSPNPYSNYFFRVEDVVGLCVEDTSVTRTVAKQLDVSDHIYFGENGDPVEYLTLKQITTLMPDIKQWYGDKIPNMNMKALRLR